MMVSGKSRKKEKVPSDEVMRTLKNLVWLLTIQQLQFKLYSVLHSLTQSEGTLKQYLRSSSCIFLFFIIYLSIYLSIYFASRSDIFTGSLKLCGRILGKKSLNRRKPAASAAAAWQPLLSRADVFQLCSDIVPQWDVQPPFSPADYTHVKQGAEHITRSPANGYIYLGLRLLSVYTHLKYFSPGPSSNDCLWLYAVFLCPLQHWTFFSVHPSACCCSAYFSELLAYMCCYQVDWRKQKKSLCCDS